MTKKNLVITFLSLVFLVSYAATTKATYTAIFAHGLGGQADNSQAYRDFVGCPIIARNGPEWNHAMYGDNVGPQQSCLAQDADIYVVRQQIEEHIRENIMLLGVSKGAATMLNTVGWLAVNNPMYLNNIKAVILDSPFSSPETVSANVVRHYIGGSAGECVGSSLDSSCMQPLVKKLETKQYPHYNSQGITPIKAVTQMWRHVDKNMVIVFVHSAKDQLISINDSRLLYVELKNLGFTNLYLIEASDGSHANVFWGTERTSIFKKLCFIYLKHDLPLPLLQDGDMEALQHLSPEQSQQLLLETQPSIKEVNQKLHPWLSWLGLV